MHISSTSNFFLEHSFRIVVVIAQEMVVFLNRDHYVEIFPFPLPPPDVASENLVKYVACL